jgi:hypothetical protein
MSKENTWLTGIHYGLGDVRHQSLRNVIGNRCLNAPTTTLEAGDKNDIETQTVPIVYSIGGVNYSAAALADENVTADGGYYGDTDVQAADTVCYYAITIDAAGAVRGYKGKDDGGIEGLGHAADECCFCVIKVTTVAVTFQIGVTDYDASGVTSVFTDVSFLPATAP